MKFIILFIFVTMAAARPDDDHIRNENFNVDEIISNKSILQAYCDCFSGTGECTPESTDIKKWIPEVVQNDCGKCSEKQKAYLAKIAIAVKEQLPEEYAKLRKLYNAEDVYNATVAEFLQKYGH